MKENQETALEERLAAERPRLVRLCKHWTGDADAAEDLSQETLLVAWSQRHKLYDPHGLPAWLAAISRNLSLRWLRSRNRGITWAAEYKQDLEAAVSLDAGEIDSGFDLEVELERDELADLLDRALGLLPEATRSILVYKYILDSPHAEIAGKLGISEGTVAVRLHRGKLALRRLLTRQLSGEAEVYGLAGGEPGGWDETRIWCPLCGQRRLHGRLDSGRGVFSLRCPACSQGPEDYLSYSELGVVLEGVRHYKPALSRLMAWAYDYYSQALISGAAVCTACGRPVPLQKEIPAEVVPWNTDSPGLYVHCNVCNAKSWETRRRYARDLPEARSFWREHRQMRTLPEEEIEFAGTPAVVHKLKAVHNASRLDIILARENYAVLGIYGT